MEWAECRTCLLRRPATVPICESTAEQIWRCSGVRVSPDDGLPGSMCVECGERLRTAHEFAELCRRSDRLLREPVTVEEVPVVVKLEPLSPARPESEPDPPEYLELELEPPPPEPESEPECPTLFAILSGAAYPRPRRPPTPGPPPRDPLSSSRAPSAPTRLRHQCDLCGETTRTKRLLAMHLRRHYTPEKHACATCGVAFATPAELGEHARTPECARRRAKRRRHACDACAFHSRTREGLRWHRAVRHYAVGEQARPHACAECGLAFYTRAELAGHARNQHSAAKKLPACPACGAEFARGADVAEHVRDAHGLRYSRGRLLDYDGIE